MNISGYGERIRTIRESQGVTREDLCQDEAELSIRQLTRIEKEESVPTLRSLMYIARKLDVSIESFVNDENRTKIPKEYETLRRKLFYESIEPYIDNIDRIEEITNQIMEEYFFTLPSEEQLFIEVINTLIEIQVTQDLSYGKTLNDLYDFHYFDNKEIHINELLLLRLKSLYIETEDEAKAFEERILKKIIVGTDEEMYMLVQILINICTTYLFLECYEEMFHLLQITTRINDDARVMYHKPVILLLYAKYYVYKKDEDMAEEYYQKSKKLADLQDLPLLKQNIQNEMNEDL